MGQDINLDFLDAYNRVEKILKDMYRDDDPSLSGAFQYCEDMRKHAPYARHIAHWEAERAELDRLRRARNNVSHEPGLLRANIFTEEDILWIEDFGDRLVAGTDPMALLHKKEAKRRAVSLPKTTPLPTPRTAPVHRKNPSGTGCLLALSGAVLVVTVLLIIFL